jgi:hypothetical protein
MSTEGEAPRRAAVVLARYGAGAAAPAGTDPVSLARAALADTYEVLADLVGVTSGIAGGPEVAELLWPGALHLPELPLTALAHRLAGEVDELVLVPGDVPDLPGLVLAKVFKVLHRTDVAVAPERGGPGCVVLGLRLPLASWLEDEALDLDDDPYERLMARAPRRAACQRTPDWHRLRTGEALGRLDPGLEGWEETRLLLAEAGVLRW